MSFTQQLLVILALIAGSAFFAVSEISLAAARRIKLTVLADAGDSRARDVLLLQERPGHFFTAIQVGVNAVAILAGIFGESMLTPYFHHLIGLAHEGPLQETLSVALSFLTITALFIVFADLTPKRLAMLAPEQVALRVVGLTATPYRLQGQAVPVCGAEHILTEIAYEARITDLIADGYLSRLVSKAGECPDLSGVAKRGGEYIDESLAAAMMPLVPRGLHSMVNSAPSSPTMKSNPT